MATSWSLAPLIEHGVQQHPTRVLATDGERTWTYHQVDADASSLATAFSGLGLGLGDRIAVNLPNGIEWIIATLAAAKLGAVVVPVSPQLSIHDLRYQLRHAEASAVVTIARWDGVHFLQRFHELLGDLPDLQYVVTVGDEERRADDRILSFQDLVVSGAGNRCRHRQSMTTRPTWPSCIRRGRWGSRRAFRCRTGRWWKTRCEWRRSSR